jgi:hypothetical protein
MNRAHIKIYGEFVRVRKPLKRLKTLHGPNTRLKPGANEINPPSAHFVRCALAPVNEKLAFNTVKNAVV